MNLINIRHLVSSFTISVLSVLLFVGSECYEYGSIPQSYHPESCLIELLFGLEDNGQIEKNADHNKILKNIFWLHNGIRYLYLYHIKSFILPIDPPSLLKFIFSGFGSRSPPLLEPSSVFHS